MNINALDYLTIVSAACDQLTEGTEITSIREAIERLREIAPDHGMLPALEAKIARAETITALRASALDC